MRPTIADEPRIGLEQQDVLANGASITKFSAFDLPLESMSVADPRQPDVTE